MSAGSFFSYNEKELITMKRESFFRLHKVRKYIEWDMRKRMEENHELSVSK